MLVIPGAIALFIFLHNWLVVKLGVTSPPWSRTRYDESARPRFRRGVPVTLHADEEATCRG